MFPTGECVNIGGIYESLYVGLHLRSVTLLVYQAKYKWLTIRVSESDINSFKDILRVKELLSNVDYFSIMYT